MKEIFKQIKTANGMWIAPLWIEERKEPGYNSSLIGLTIYINTLCILNYSDSQMALSIGHEIAHFRRRIQHIRMSNIDMEYDCDLAGLKYAIKAGYDGANAIEKYKLWPGFSTRLDSATHPSPKNRYERLKSFLSTQ